MARTDFRLPDGRVKTVCRCHWPPHGFRRLTIPTVVLQDLQHLQHRPLALVIGQGMQTSLELPHPLAEIVNAFDRMTGFDQPVDVLVDPDAVVMRIHHVVGLKIRGSVE